MNVLYAPQEKFVTIIQKTYKIALPGTTVLAAYTNPIRW